MDEQWPCKPRAFSMKKLTHYLRTKAGPECKETLCSVCSLSKSAETLIKAKNNQKAEQKNRKRQTDREGRFTWSFALQQLRASEKDAGDAEQPGHRLCGDRLGSGIFINLHTCWVTMRRTNQTTQLYSYSSSSSPSITAEPGVLDHDSEGEQRAVKLSDWVRGSLKYR